MISLGYEELQSGALFKFRPVVPLPMVVKDVSGGKFMYKIYPSMKLMDASTLKV